MRGKIVGGFVAVLLVGALCGSRARAAPTNVSAAQAFANQVSYFFNAQFDRYYDALVPQQRRFITRDRFLGCMERRSKDTAELTVDGWKQIDSLHVRILIPGTTVRVWTTAVTLRFRIRDRNTGERVQFTRTAHMVLIGGRWRWMLASTEAAAFKRGACPK